MDSAEVAVPTSAVEVKRGQLLTSGAAFEIVMGTNGSAVYRLFGEPDQRAIDELVEYIEEGGSGVRQRHLLIEPTGGVEGRVVIGIAQPQRENRQRIPPIHQEDLAFIKSNVIGNNGLEIAVSAGSKADTFEDAFPEVAGRLLHVREALADCGLAGRIVRSGPFEPVQEFNEGTHRFTFTLSGLNPQQLRDIVASFTPHMLSRN